MQSLLKSTAPYVSEYPEEAVDSMNELVSSLITLVAVSKYIEQTGGFLAIDVKGLPGGKDAVLTGFLDDLAGAWERATGRPVSVTYDFMDLVAGGPFLEFVRVVTADVWRYTDEAPPSDEAIRARLRDRRSGQSVEKNPQIDLGQDADSSTTYSTVNNNRTGEHEEDKRDDRSDPEGIS